MAEKIPEFAALAAGKLGDLGVRLTGPDKPLPVAERAAGTF